MSSGRKGKAERRDVELAALVDIIDQATERPLRDDERATLRAAVDTLAVVTRELEGKGASVRRLRKLIFGATTEIGATTERARKVVGEPPPDEGDGDEGAQGSGKRRRSKKTKKARKGHGRNGAKAYRGADKVRLPHPTLAHKAPCPACERGKVYMLAEPAVLIRIKGVAPLQATVYERDRLRCNLCGEVFMAPPPSNTSDKKYDETAAAMIALLKYGCGLPFNRLERLEGSLGIPLPASTQWEVVLEAAGALQPVYDELIRQAAQGEVVHNDDTTMRILDLDGDALTDALAEDAPDDVPEDRKGIFTSGIVSIAGGRRIALFFTGRRHAGENLAVVLARRAKALAAPIQMCDALNQNTAGDFDSIVANCLAHGRRKFVDVAPSFPDECAHVLMELRKVYANDADTRERQLTPEARLAFHQAHSKPIMDDLEAWLKAQLHERRIEPNSGLGDAINYMLKRWTELTRFLELPGAPLDNNLCERALKKAILHRKNAYFYKTPRGARVGDLHMSLIHTAELCGADPFDYLVTLQRHAATAAAAPAAWMPWSYAETRAALTADSGTR